MADHDASEVTPEPAAPSEPRGRNVARNSTAVAASQLTISVVGLFLTPFIINELGLAQFGLFSLITVTTAYLSVLDPGLGTIVIRYGSRAQREGDPKLPARLVGLGVLVWLAIGIVLAPFVVVATTWIVDLFHQTSEAARAETVAFMRWGFVYIVFSSVISIINCRLIAEGKQWLSAAFDVTSRIIYAVVLVATLLAHWGLFGLAFATTLQVVLVAIASVIAIRINYGAIFANPFTLGRARLREILRFGGWVQLTGIFDLLNWDTDGVVLAFTPLHAAATGIYSAADRLTRQIATIAGYPQQTLLQAFSAAHSEESGTERLRHSAKDAAKIVGFIGVTLACAVLGSAPVLMPAFLNSSTHMSQLVAATMLLAALHLVNATRYTAPTVIVAMGRAGIGARAKGIAVVVNAIFTLALVFPFGMAGVLIGTIMASVVQSAVLLPRLFSVLGTTANDALWGWYLKVAACGLTAAAVTYVSVMAMPTSTHNHRGPALVALAIAGVVYLVVFSIAIKVVGYFTTDEMGYLGKILPGPLGALARSRSAKWFAVSR